MNLAPSIPLHPDYRAVDLASLRYTRDVGEGSNRPIGTRRETRVLDDGRKVEIDAPVYDASHAAPLMRSLVEAHGVWDQIPSTDPQDLSHPVFGSDEPFDVPAGHGIDGGGNGSMIGNAVITYAVVGTAAAGALAWDQAWFFSQIGDIVVDATYAIATVTPSSTRFTNAQVADFISFQPFCAVNMNLVAASADAVVSGLQMQPIRLTPFGTESSATIYNLQYQTTADFKSDRGQIPFSEIVDGYTYLRLISPIQVAAATYSCSFLLGLRPDRRAQVPRLPAQVLNSSGVAR